MRNFTYFKLLMPNNGRALNRFLVCFLLLFVFGSTAYSQVQTTHSAGPNDATILSTLNGSGVVLSNAVIAKGDRTKQIAIFSGGALAGLGIDKGILFSTGFANSDLSTKNTSKHVDNKPVTANGTIDPDLASLNTTANYDAVVYTFKVTLDPKMTAIRIFFQFGSEEYPNYVGSKYNDVFGFFISGPGVAGTQNIAKLPSSNREISVNSVNGGVLGFNKDGTGTPTTDLNQTAFYINNGHSNTGAADDGNGPRPVFVEYNGLTKRMSYDLTQLTPGATYNFKIAIADVGDEKYDSGVFVDVITASYGADLSVKKEVVGVAKKVGDEATFLISAYNAGPYAATGVKVNDLLPSGYTFVSATPSVGTYNSGTGVWDIGALANRGNATLTVKGILKAKGDYNNIAKITGNEEDPDPLNNESSSQPVKAPVANNDSGSTIGGTAVTIAVTTNDTDPDGTINVATVDLDPLTPGIQTTFTVTGEGSYSVDASGIVTFTPLATFSGIASLNYVVNDNDGFTSNAATITVTVKTKPPTANAQAFCSGDLKKITDLQVTGNDVKWYDSLTGGTLYDVNHTLVTRTYYASQTINSEESTRTAVTVTINAAPTVPIVTVVDNCDGTSRLSTSATGTLLWSNGATTSSIVVSTAGTYTVTTTVNGCTNSGSGIAAPKTAPAEPTATAQTFCSVDAKKVGDLKATGTDIKWYTASTNGTLHAENDVLVSGTYYASQTIDGCESARTAVVVKITPTPAEPTATAQTFCSVDAKKVSDLKATGTDIKWYTASTNGTLHAANDVLVSGTYYASQTIDGCESARTAVVVKITPTPAEPTATAQTFCSADVKKVEDLKATGTDIKWYTASTNGTLHGANDVLVSGTYYASQTIDGCESARTAVVVKITPTPAEPTATAQTFCSVDAKKVSDLKATGTDIKWYTASTNGTLHGANDVLVSGTYYASQTIDGCESARTAVVVTITPTPAEPTAAAQTFCSVDAKKVSNLQATGTDIKWYTASTNGTLHGANDVLVSGTYYASQTIDGCESARTAVVVTLTPTPAEPTATAQTFCSADVKKVSDLKATGTDIKWYTASTNGTLHGANDVLVSATYYASQTIDGCESARTAVVVTITPTPAEPTATAQTFCSADVKKVSNLQATGTDIKWYTASTNGTLHGANDLLVSGTYYASQTIDGCESARTAVVVKITPTPAEPTATAQTFCSADVKKVSNLQATGTDIKWYTASTNGTLHGANDVLVSGTYYASQTIDGCESARTAVVVKITPTPAEPTAKAQTFCSADVKKVSNLQATGTDIKWYTASTNGTLHGANDLLVSGTYYASQTIDGCESARTAVVVKITPTPAEPKLGKITQPTCLTPTGSIELSDLPSGNWTINPGNISGNTTSTTITGLVPGTNYSFTVTSDDCISAPSNSVTMWDVICAITETTTPINGNTGGKTPALTSNDKLNGVDVVIGTSRGDVVVTPVTVPTGLTLNPDGTVTIAPNTPAGNYDVKYKICEVTNPTNCDEVTSVVVVSQPVIKANTETTPPINGNTGGKTPALTANDKLNGVDVVIGINPGDVVVTPVTVPTGLTLNPDGTVTIAPNTPAGNYDVKYKICEVTNPTNCDEVTSVVVVSQPVIKANTETTTPINGNTGGKTPALTTNDKLNGVDVVIGTNPGEVKLTPVTVPTGLTLNPDGTVTIAPNTPAGNYDVKYKICEVTNPTNCDEVTSVVVVSQPVIKANTETTTPINGNTGGKTPALTANDKLNGVDVVIGTNPGDVVLTPVTVPTELTLNPDGTVTIAPNTPAGNYDVKYKICEVTNPTNCDEVTSVVVVSQPVIKANTETTAPIDGNTGGKTPALTANDKLNGVDVVIGTSRGEVELTPVAVPTGLTLNPDGTVTIAPNTPAGNYDVKYKICEVTNPTNCDEVTSVVVVSQPVIKANTETTTPINGNTGGKTPALTANDKLNGVDVVIGTNPGDVVLTPVTVPTGLTLNPDGTVTIAPNTPAGNYDVKYKICEVTNSTNCDEVTSVVVVSQPVIKANTETTTPINGNTGGKTPALTANDKLNGVDVVIGTNPGDVVLTPVTVPTGLTLNPDGTVTIAPNTPAGNYDVKYKICEVTNPTNCDEVTSVVVVSQPVIKANTETTTPINGNTGGKTPALTANDKLNGVDVVIGTNRGEVELTPVTVPTGLTLNPDGTVTIAPNTPAGNYDVKYKICEVTNPTNCDEVTSVVVVSQPVIKANTETTTPINGNTGGKTPALTTNDKLNGVDVVIGTNPGEVKLTPVTVPTGLTLNPDGTVTVAPNTPAGNYDVKYKICEVTNPTNCDEVTSVVVVSQPVIKANTETTTPINGNTGGKTPALTTNDKLNGVDVVIGTNPGEVKLTPVTVPTGLTLNPDGTVTVAPNTPAGNYDVKYKICEVTNPTNCDEVTSVVVVSQPVIKANTETTTPINGNTGGKTPALTANDKLNGVDVVIGTNPGDVVLTPVTVPTGLTLNPDGTVTVSPNTPAGNYDVKYKICEVTNPTNCDEVTSIIEVGAAAIDAQDDNVIYADGINGSLEVINVLDNDKLNGIQINNPAVVTIKSLNTLSGITLNVDGTIDVAPNTAGGTYTLNYQICDVINKTSCVTAKVTIFVAVPSIAVIKTAVFNDENKSGYANAGETITYKFKITNTGNTPLTNITVSDPLPGLVMTGGPITLGVNETDEHTFIGIYVIKQADINAGKISNQATVYGTSANGIIVEDKSDYTSNVDDNPTVSPIEGCVIKVFNAISPNGDSMNERFYIQGLECYPENTVEIYNRWGVLVFERERYNNEERAFRGVSEGRTTVKQSDGLPVGTYYYVLKYKDSDSNAHQEAGYLYINK